jgi:peroxiredoxin
MSGEAGPDRYEEPMTNPYILPANLPRPVDDGACNHLLGIAMPGVTLPSSAGRQVDLGALPPGRTVIYCYPRTGRPGEQMPEGWDAIPGARGCTPQSCSFRDHHRELADLGAEVYGLSTQTTEEQIEVAERLHLPFELLSDAELRFARALRLPTFEAGGMTLIKRLTLIVRDGAIEHVFYPVFPPDESAGKVLDWLQSRELG